MLAGISGNVSLRFTITKVFFFIISIILMITKHLRLICEVD